MSISFNRNRAQVLYEGFVGIESPEKLKENRIGFKEHSLSAEEAERLQVVLKQDALDFFYNGVVSFSEGIDAIFLKRFSWATVELYYSIYYLLRASMASKGIAILRCDRMYRLIARGGETPFSTQNKKYRTTHEGTLSHYRDIFLRSDKLLSNKIEDRDAYEWMMNAREIVHYKSSAFLEPGCFEIWEYFFQAISDGTLADVLLQLENDPYIKCFQEEFAIVAIPIKCMQQTIADMERSGLLANITEERGEFAKSVIGYDERSLLILSQVFDS